MTKLNAINTLEKACLADYPEKRTTKKEIMENGPEETKKYFTWLKQQAPNTALFIPRWEELK